MNLPVHDHQHRASLVRVGMQHQNATDAERDGAAVNLHGKATQRAKVYGLICASGSDGMTSSELHEHTGIERHVLSARLKELENDSLVMKSGLRRLATTGVRQNVYMKVPAEGTLL